MSYSSASSARTRRPVLVSDSLRRRRMRGSRRIVVVAVAFVVGAVSGRVDSRVLSLERIHAMLRSVAHEELGGSEDAWRRAVEIEQEAVDRHGGRVPYLACAEAGRANARRLGVLAGGRAYVEPLYHRQDAMCSVVGLDRAGAAAVAADGGFALSPLPHIAKLAPSLAMSFGGVAGSDPETEGTDALPLPQQLLERLRRGAVDALVVTLTPGLGASHAAGVAMGESWLAQLQRDGGARHLQERFLWARDSSLLLNSGATESLKQDGGAGELQGYLLATPHAKSRAAGWRRLLQGAGAGSCDFAGVAVEGAPSGRKLVLKLPGGGGTKEASSSRLPLAAACASTLLAYLSTRPEVAHVDARGTAVTFNLEEAWVAQSGVENYWPLWSANLTGKGQVLALADTGVDRYHCFFREARGKPVEPSNWDAPVTDPSRRKIIQYIAFQDDVDAVDGHGTHVAGTLAGSVPNSNPEDYDAGGAYDAQLAVFDFGDSSSPDSLTVPNDIPNIMFQPAIAAGAFIHSDSWGTSTNSYSELDRDIDDFVYNNQRFLMVVAAGNCGDDASPAAAARCNGIGPFNAVMSPALAKNVIGVGASESGGRGPQYDIDALAYFSSRGPTLDGRIKPDIVGPGDPVASADSAGSTANTCGIFDQVGTSMATPVVAANAALARQYFMEGWYQKGKPNLEPGVGFEPSAALLKAVMVNSATGLSTARCDASGGSCADVALKAPPDDYQGHGRIQMDQGLNVGGTVGLWLRDWVNITEGQTITYNVTILAKGDPTKNLRVTLVWSDPAGFVAASEQVVHNLDLRVTHLETGDVYLPNGLSRADSTNNVEKVVVPEAVPNNTYIIEVSGITITQADVQAFALVANGEFIKTIDPPEPPPQSTSSGNPSVGNISFTWETVIFAGIALIAFAFLCGAGRWLLCTGGKCRRRSGGDGVGGGSSGAAVAAAPSGRSKRGISLPRRRASSQEPLPMVLVPSPVGGSATSSDSGGPRPTPPGAVSAARPSSRRARERVAPVWHPPREICPECGASFGDVVELVSHVETRHNGVAHRSQPMSVMIPAPVAYASPRRGGGGRRQ